MVKFDLNRPPFVLLDDSRSRDKAGPSYLFHSPSYIIQALEFDQITDAIAAIDKALADGLHVAGWISYECAAAFEPKLQNCINIKADEPLIWMMATESRETLQPSEVRALLSTQKQSAASSATQITVGALSQARDSYSKALGTIADFIKAGDVYQINHTLRAPIEANTNCLNIYKQLRQNQPVAYGAYIDTGQENILSLSPELFLEKKGRQLRGKPMKGTAPRGKTTAEDTAIRSGLKNDEKCRAENLMILDLIRNDLSRIAEPGTVSVPHIYDVEQYSTLYQMTSTVTAEAKEGLCPSELLNAIFPCGSVTGAPKIRAMEIIQTLESAARGVYCGAIGHFSPATKTQPENWCLNVPIRTLVMKQNSPTDTSASCSGRLNIGGGIIADSVASDEYDECLLKAAFASKMHEDFSLIETMRAEGGLVEL